MRKAPKAGNVSESLDPLLKLEVAKIFLNYIGHGHAQRRGEVLRRHGGLLVRILQQPDQAFGEALSVSGRIKLNRQFLALRHLPEVAEIRTNNRYAISTS